MAVDVTDLKMLAAQELAVAQSTTVAKDRNRHLLAAAAWHDLAERRELAEQERQNNPRSDSIEECSGYPLPSDFGLRDG